MARPKKVLNSKDYDEVVKLASQGLSIEMIAYSLGISESTFYKMKRNDDKLEQAYKQGKAKGIEFVTSKLFEQIDKGNTTAIIFYLKTQGGWRETTALEHKHSGEVKADVNDVYDLSKLSDDELRQIIALSDKAQPIN